MKYVAAVESGSDDQAFGVQIPDLEGCNSAGDTLQEALENAKEALAFHLESLLEDGLEIPTPSPIESFQDTYGVEYTLYEIAVDDDLLIKMNAAI